MENVVKQLLEFDNNKAARKPKTLLIILTDVVRTYFDEDLIKNKNNFLNIKGQLNIMKQEAVTTVLYLEKLRYLYIFLTYLTYNEDTSHDYDNVVLYGLDVLIYQEARNISTETIRLTNMISLNLKELKQNYKNKALDVVILPVNNSIKQHFKADESENIQQGLDLIYKMISINSDFF